MGCLKWNLEFLNSDLVLCTWFICAIIACFKSRCIWDGVTELVYYFTRTKSKKVNAYLQARVA